MKIQELLQKLEQDIQKSSKQLDKASQLLRLKEMMQIYHGEDSVVSFDEIAEKIKLNKDELKIMSGWKGIDDILGGFRLQQVVVVSALTKSGKTSWLMDLTTKIKEHNPLWFPFEESAEELIRKYVERGQEPPHGYTPQNIKGSTLEWIESRIIESIAKYNSRVVFIDQLDFIVPFNGDNHSLRIGQAMRELKAIAKKWNVCIFLICHLVKTRMDTNPSLEDLKGSSSIGQEADTVILLWRETIKKNNEIEITNNTNISIQANRRTGKTGNVKFVFDNGRFIESEWIDKDLDGIKPDDDYINGIK
jgi:replicative DNA helicase